MKYEIKVTREESHSNDLVIYCVNEDNVTLAKATVLETKTEPLSEHIQQMITSEEKYLREEYKLSETDDLIFMDEGNLEYLYSIKNKAVDLEDSLKNGVYIGLINAYEEGTHAGTFIVDYLKEKYDFIVLYSICDATEFWEKKEFKPFYTEDYFYFDKKNLISFLD